MHRVLGELGVEDDVLLWNVVPTHPGTRRTNRRPTRERCAPPARSSTSSLADVASVAVGRLAATVLDAPYVRHPSHGGAAAFAEGLEHMLAG